MTGPYNKKSQGSLRRLSFFKILLVLSIFFLSKKKKLHQNERMKQNKKDKCIRMYGFNPLFVTFVK